MAYYFVIMPTNTATTAKTSSSTESSSSAPHSSTASSTASQVPTSSQVGPTSTSTPGGTSSITSEQSTSASTTSPIVTTSSSTTTEVTTWSSSSTLICASPNITAIGTYSNMTFPVAMFDSFPSMTLRAVINSTGFGSSGVNMTSSYSFEGIEQLGSTPYHKVVVSLTEEAFGSSNTNTITIWIDQAGRVGQVLYNGVIMTGESAQNEASGSGLSVFYSLYYVDAMRSWMTAGGSFHEINQTSVVLGPSSALVTYYTADSVPYTYPLCGQGAVMNEMSFGIGTIQGASNQLITYVHISVALGTQYIDETISLTSVTKA